MRDSEPERDMSGPRVFGYACSSRYGDEPVVEAQAIEIERRAQSIAGEFAGCETEREKGPEDSLGSRPTYQSLLASLQEGDRLVVFSLNTLASSPRELTGAIQHLASRGVHVHTVEQKGGQLNLDPASLEILAQCWRVHDDVFAAHVKVTTRKSLRNKKARSLAYCSRPPIGKKRVVQRFGGKTMRFDIWDIAECDLIRGIHRRKTEGESFQDIAADFCARKSKKADGRRWVLQPKRGRQHDTSSIRRAYRFYIDILSRGLDLGDDDAYLVGAAIRRPT